MAQAAVATLEADFPEVVAVAGCGAVTVVAADQVAPVVWTVAQRAAAQMARVATAVVRVATAVETLAAQVTQSTMLLMSPTIRHIARERFAEPLGGPDQSHGSSKPYGVWPRSQR